MMSCDDDFAFYMIKDESGSKLGLLKCLLYLLEELHILG